MLFKSKKTNIQDFDVAFLKRTNTLYKVYYQINNMENSALSNYPAEVIFVMDYSYSMEDNFRKGKVNKIFETLLPLGLKLGNGIFVDVMLFNREFYLMPNLRKDNCQTYLRRYLPNYQKFPMGGTDYSSALCEILNIHNKHILDYPNNKIITYVVFLTDGECKPYEIKKTYTIMNKISQENIFLQFVKIGNKSLDTIKRLEQEFANVSFLNKDIMENIPDEKLYRTLLIEYNNWLKNC